MRFGKNLLASLANSGWSAIVGLAVIPFYIKLLGIEAYGLIGFFVTMQAVLFIFDFGLSPTLNREVARCSALGNMGHARNLLHSISLIYLIMAIIIGVAIYALAPFIANNWLQSQKYDSATIIESLRLMAMVIAFRWPVSIYQNTLIGAQRFIITSVLSITMTSVSSLGGIVVIKYFSPTIIAFFQWQLLVTIIYLVIVRYLAWRVIGPIESNRFDFKSLISVRRFSANMGVIAIIGVFFTQLDKIILSKMLGLEAYGQYMLATVIASTLYLLVSPIFNVIYPRFSELVAKNDLVNLTKLYQLGSQLLACILFPIGMLIALFAYDIVFIWTGDEGIAANVSPILALLSLGSSLHGMMYFPYALQLAHGMTNLSVKIALILLIVLAPLTISFTYYYGAIGAATAWLVLHILYIFFGTWMTHRYILKGKAVAWLLRDVGTPLFVSLIVGLLGKYLIQAGEHSSALKLIWAMVLILLIVLITISVLPKLRSAIFEFLNFKTRVVI